jgi:hypothetical protein
VETSNLLYTFVFHYKCGTEIKKSQTKIGTKERKKEGENEIR